MLGGQTLVKNTVAVVGVIVLIVALSFALLAWAGALRFLGINIQREVNQHSQAYVEAHQSAIVHYYADYTAATDDAHKNAARLNVCAEATLLEREEWPFQVSGFIQTHC